MNRQVLNAPVVSVNWILRPEEVLIDSPDKVDLLTPILHRPGGFSQLGLNLLGLQPVWKVLDRAEGGGGSFWTLPACLY